MSEERFAFDLAYAIVIGVLYGAVALAVARRHVGPKAEQANQAFVTWWAGLSLLSLVGAVAQVVGRMDLWTFAAFLTYTQSVLILITVALMALMYYFVYLFTGSKAATSATVVYYLAFMVALFHWVNTSQPIGLIEGANGGVELEYARDLGESWLGRSLGILLLLPLVLGSLAYTTLWFKVHDRAQRIRIITVGGSIFFWMLTSLGASLGGVDANEQTWWLYVSRGIAIAATLANYMAFQPPAWMRRKMGLEPPEPAAPAS